MRSGISFEVAGYISLNSFVTRLLDTDLERLRRALRVME